MEEQTTQGIDLSVFLHNFRRTLQHFFWVPIVLGLLLGGVSWLRAARSYAPVYQSSAVFSVSAGFSSSTDILSHSTYLDSNAAAQLSATFPYVLQSDRMQLLLQQELGDQRAPVSLSASSVADAALFTLTATGSDPQAVYDTLLAAIEVYPAAATTILGDTQIQVIDQPVEPSAAPINANTALQTGIRRGVVGLVLGLVLVALLSLTRRTVHSAEDLHRLISLSCLSSIPAVRRGKRTRREAPSLLLTHAGTGSDFSEAMRNLSLKLQRITSKHGAKVVLITSTVPGEGKTTVASNLALALAAEGKRVILIDGDLRKQSLKPLFGIGAHSDGLVEVLSGKAKNFRLLPVPDSSLLLLSGDGTVAQPQRLLGSPRMGQILELLRQKLDYILIDTPPAGVLSDAAALAKYADGAIYVVRQDMANSVQIVNSVQSLSGAVPLYGCVLNCTQAGTTRSGYRYGYRYGYQYGYSSHYSLNGEFHILHVFVVIFKVVANINQFLIQVGPFFFQRSAVTLRGHRLRRTNTGHNVFTLCINQIFAVINIFAGRRVTGEANAGSAVIARITKDHGLNVNGCAPVARNVVELAVGNGAVNHPGTEYGADTGPQLFPRILRNNFAQLFADFFIFVNQLFEVFRSQIRVRFVAFGLFHIFQSFFIQIQIGAHNHVRKHLQETAIRVISKSFASGSFSQSFNGFVVQTEVQNRIHHTRHRNAGAGTNREQQRIIGVGKFFAHNLLNAGNSLANLIFEVGRILVIIVVIIRADFRCDGESRRYRQTDLVHFCKVGTFTAEEITHGGVAFGLAVTKCIYPFTHGYYRSYSNS